MLQPRFTRAGIVITRLRKRIDKFPVCQAQVDTFDRPCFQQARQDFLTDSWQDGIGQDRIDHAAATFVFRAAAHDVVNDLRIVGKRDLVMVNNTSGNPSKLQPDNVGQNGMAERVVGNDDETPQQGGWKGGKQRFPYSSGQTVRGG